MPALSDPDYPRVVTRDIAHRLVDGGRVMAVCTGVRRR